MRISFLMTVLIIIISDWIRNTLFWHEENLLNIWYHISISSWNQGGHKRYDYYFKNGVVSFQIWYNAGKGVTIYTVEQLFISSTTHYTQPPGELFKKFWYLVSTNTHQIWASGSGDQVSALAQNFLQMILISSQDWEPHNKGGDSGESKGNRKLWRRPWV